MKDGVITKGRTQINPTFIEKNKERHYFYIEEPLHDQPLIPATKGQYRIQYYDTTYNSEKEYGGYSEALLSGTMRQNIIFKSSKVLSK